MKTGIFVGLAALAAFVFIAPHAQGKGGSDLSVSLSGSNIVISTENGVPTPTTQAGVSYGQGISKGSGSPLWVARTTFDTPLPDVRCSEALPFGNDLTSNVILTYKDGSILEIVAGAGSFFCSDGVLFVAQLQGTVVGGEKRFDGATGVWAGVAEVDGARLTGELTIDLD